MELHQMPGHLIRRLNQHSTHVFQSRMRAEGYDLTPVQFAAMGALEAEPGIDQATVAARIAYDRATIGGVIDRLVAKGWVSRQVSETDRRARVLTLTEAGAATFAQVLPLVRSVQPAITPGLTEQERAQFLTLARRIADSLDVG